MDINMIKKLNLIYEPLYKYTMKLVNELKELNYDAQWGFYGFHSIRHKDEFITEFFPIPVITVRDICDIGVDLNHIFIEGKLTREAAMKFDYSLLQDYTFEVYGINDYLNDFYNSKLDVEGIGRRIEESKEKEIGIQIFLQSNCAFSKIIEAVGKCQKWNTYIMDR